MEILLRKEMIKRPKSTKLSNYLIKILSFPKVKWMDP